MPGAKVWPRADLYIYNDPMNEDWSPDDEAEEVEFRLTDDIDGWDAGKCYSSHEAAERAAKDKVIADLRERCGRLANEVMAAPSPTDPVEKSTSSVSFVREG